MVFDDNLAAGSSTAKVNNWLHKKGVSFGKPSAKHMHTNDVSICLYNVHNTAF